MITKKQENYFIAKSVESRILSTRTAHQNTSERSGKWKRRV